MEQIYYELQNKYERKKGKEQEKSMMTPKFLLQ